MTFNPFNLFKGNPKVLELMGKNQPMDLLLMQEPFISEFKRSQNQALQSYMNYEKYNQLIEYITEIKQENAGDKNKGYRFPFVSAEILAINNEMTFKYLLEETVFTQQEIQEEIEVEKEIDSESSDRSYSSIKSNNSNRSRHDSRDLKAFEEADKENFIIRSGEDKILADYLSEDKEIDQDDFPDAKLKKTIIVKQKNVRTVKVPNKPLIFNILKYFQERPVVHILDGYVSKVLENIINNRFEGFVSIMQKYNQFDTLKNIFSHIDSNSVQQFLLNFITKMVDSDSVTPLSDEVALLSFIQSRCLQRVQFWQQIKLPIQQRVYFLYLYSLLLDKITNKIKDKATDHSTVRIQKQLVLIDKIANDQHIGELASILSELISDSERKSQHSQVIKAYLKIIKNILQTFLCLKSLKTKETISKEQLMSMQKILDRCEDAFDCIINLGFSYIFEDFLLMEGEEHIKYKPQNTMTSKLQFLEIIGKLVQENVYFSMTTVIDNPFFDHILKIMQLYPNSSIFHNHILKIVIPFLNPDNELSIVNKFFQKKMLFSFIYETVRMDYQSRYELKVKKRECYIGQIISICTAIEEYDNSESQDCRNLKQTEQWQFIHECLLQDAKGVNKKLLGGLEKKNEKKPVIFFTKNECLHHFRYFLSGVKYNMFEEFENYEPGNSDSEDQGDPAKKYFDIEDDDKVKEGTQIEDDSKYFDENIEL